MILFELFYLNKIANGLSVNRNSRKIQMFSTFAEDFLILDA